MKEEDIPMEFQLSQARLRATVGTLAIVCSVAIPFFGWLGTRYVSNVDEAASAVGRLTTELAVLNTQVTYLREDIASLKGTVRDIQAGKAVFIGPLAKTSFEGKSNE